MMKRLLILALTALAGFARAQTNTPSLPAPKQLEVSSAHGYFDGLARQMIYQGDVVVIDGPSRLTCAQLVVNLPPDGGHPTNIIAFTNVVLDAVDERGATNHITAEKAIYAFQIEGSVTNESITFTGGNPSPKVDHPMYTIYGEPLVLDVRTRKFSGSGYRTIFKQMPGSNGTNGSSPFNVLK